MPLPDDCREGLAPRLQAFLQQEQVYTTRVKKNRPEQIDLRPWVLELQQREDLLWMKMASGSPLFLAAHLLQRDVEEVRTLGICKTGIELKDSQRQVDL